MFLTYRHKEKLVVSDNLPKGEKQKNLYRKNKTKTEKKKKTKNNWSLNKISVV